MPHSKTTIAKRKIGYATKPTMVNEDTLLNFLTITPASLSVAQENYKASQPPIRSLDVTQEILKMVKNSAIAQGIQNELTDIIETQPSKTIMLADLRR